ncbi:MAG: hypothetical protein ACK5LP_03800 [Campylobacteraceae bacterium]
MKLYSYINKKAVELNSLHISMESKEELLLLEEFIKYCVKSWNKRGKDYSHEHFIDFVEFKKKISTESNVDIEIWQTKEQENKNQ